MNSKPTHFLALMNNGKAFPSFDGIVCSYQCSKQLQFLPRQRQPKRYWIS